MKFNAIAAACLVLTAAPAQAARVSACAQAESEIDRLTAEIETIETRAQATLIAGVLIIPCALATGGLCAGAAVPLAFVDTSSVEEREERSMWRAVARIKECG